MNATKIDLAEKTDDREIVITRVVEAPRELVWEAMTDPRQVVHWWGPQGFTTTIERMEVRPGGVWRHVMHGPARPMARRGGNFVCIPDTGRDSSAGKPEDGRRAR